MGPALVAPVGQATHPSDCRRPPTDAAGQAGNASLGLPTAASLGRGEPPPGSSSRRRAALPLAPAC
eukprot:7911727-Alexandrium_andersonii.AAC.1